MGYALKKLTTMVRIVVFFWENGSPLLKSRAVCNLGWLGTGKECKSPVGASWRSCCRHSGTGSVTESTEHQQKYLFRTEMVQLEPGCQENQTR